MTNWLRNGSPWIWLSGSVVAISLILVAGLLGLIASRGFSHFWPNAVMVADYKLPGQTSKTVAGEVVNTEEAPAVKPETLIHLELVTRSLLKVGNQDINGIDFVWVVDLWLTNHYYPSTIMTIERREWGNFYGYLDSVKQAGEVVASDHDAWNEFQQRIQRAQAIFEYI